MSGVRSWSGSVCALWLLQHTLLLVYPVSSSNLPAKQTCIAHGLSRLSCASCCVLQLVFSSSCTVYGIPKSSPITEDTPLGAAINPYGRTKLFQEEMFR